VKTVDVGAVNFGVSCRMIFTESALTLHVKSLYSTVVFRATVEELSKGHPYNHYNRVIEAVTKVNLYRQPAAWRTVGIVAFLYMQGEWNYWTSTTGTHDRATFLELTKQLRIDLITDCAYGICGQKLPPACGNLSNRRKLYRRHLQPGNRDGSVRHGRAGSWVLSGNAGISGN
jgi:hypothetical protein